MKTLRTLVQTGKNGTQYEVVANEVPYIGVVISAFSTCCPTHGLTVHYGVLPTQAEINRSRELPPGQVSIERFRETPSGKLLGGLLDGFQQVDGGLTVKDVEDALK